VDKKVIFYNFNLPFIKLYIHYTYIIHKLYIHYTLIRFAPLFLKVEDLPIYDPIQLIQAQVTP